MKQVNGNTVSTLFKNGFGLLREWWQREERRELAMMGERDLRDMEVTRAHAVAESPKAFWTPITLRRASQEAGLSSAAIQQDDGAKAPRARRADPSPGLFRCSAGAVTARARWRSGRMPANPWTSFAESVLC